VDEEALALSAVGKIKTPVLVVEGARDPGVNRAEAERIVIALHENGLPVEYLLSPD
jgi:dipeptidyl aminopeptidase/acylaminoacyl peptidase